MFQDINQLNSQALRHKGKINIYGGVIACY